MLTDHGGVQLAHTEQSPFRQVGKRVVIATVVLVATVLIVYFDREGYRDNNGDELSLLDATYYATVSLSTTGYGDITPITPGARLVNILIITRCACCSCSSSSGPPWRRSPRAPGRSSGSVVGGPPCASTSSCAGTAPRAAAPSARCWPTGPRRS
ncbi:potassium channel family protein [Klenkia terrae]|uniref:potassium channel family protein n=1 Tax=Klenkia terrae TaxID=1052259 RepID=UPI00361024E8